MSKFRHVEITKEEFHPKKRHKKLQEERPSNYLQTITLMEKLGIKMVNNDNLLKSMNLRKSNKERGNYAITTFNEEEKISKKIKISSLEKRNKNINKKDFISSSNEKRIIKKYFIKKVESDNNNKIKKIRKYLKDNNEKKETDNAHIKKITNKIIKKEKDNILSTSLKKRKSIGNNKDINNTSIKTKMIKTLITNEIKGSKKNANKKAKPDKFINIEKDNNINNNNNSMNKKSKDLEIKKLPKSDKKLKEINDNFNIDDDELAKEIEDIFSNKQENKIKRKYQSVSVQRDEYDKKFKLNLKIKTKNNDLFIENKNKINESIDSLYSSDNESNKTTDKIQTINSSKKRPSIPTISNHLKTENNIEKDKNNILNLKNRKSEGSELKRAIRSNQIHATEMVTGNDMNIVTNKSCEKRASMINIGNLENNKNNFRFFKRRSLDNPLARKKFDNLLRDITLRQNGGNTLYLTNFENGNIYEGKIEINIRNKNYLKNIKIGSCTKPGCCRPGVVKTNQDNYFIKEKFLDNENNYFFGVCDGHGEKGEVISQYVSEKLPEYIKIINYDSITNELKKINKEIYENKNIESNMSGTTVSSIILTSDKIISINMGDSRSCIFKYENGIYSYKNLTRDHKPSEKDESTRIINSNGRIKRCYDEQLKKYIGPERVWLKNKEEPGLAMTRSIGDKVAHSIGVIDEPEYKIFEFDGNEKFIIIASDGIWEYLNGDDCIKIVKYHYENGYDVNKASYALVKEAFDRWKRKEVSIDDITAILIFFYD